MTNIGKRNRVTILGYGEEKLDKVEFDTFKETIDEKIAEATDSNEVIGAITEKVEIVTSQLTDKATKEYVDQKVVEVNSGGTIDLSYKADVTYVEELVGVNNYSTIPTFDDNGVLNKIEELDKNIVKKRTTFTYNVDGSVNTVTDITKGKTVISTINYINGSFLSITKQVFEGGL